MRVPTRHVVAAALVVGGAAHFVIPGTYSRIVPRALGDPRAWVYATGVVEVAAGALLAGRSTRRVGGWLSAVMLVVIFPANVQHALDQGGLLWARLPLQVPLVWWALREGRRPDEAQDGPGGPAGPEKRASSWANSSIGPDGTE